MQCTDDSNGARPCMDSTEEGRLLSELRNGLVFGPAAVRSLRIGEDRRTGSLDPRAVGSKPGSSARLGRVASRPQRASIRHASIQRESRILPATSAFLSTYPIAFHELVLIAPAKLS